MMKRRFFPFSARSDAFSLRGRLLMAIAAGSMFSFVIGCALAGYHATRTVRLELATALANARTVAEVALAAPDRPAVPDPAWPDRLCAMFDGNRHVQAELVNSSGLVLQRSHLANGRSPPEWFLRLIAPSLAPLNIPVDIPLHHPGIGAAAGSSPSRGGMMAPVSGTGATIGSTLETTSGLTSTAAPDSAIPAIPEPKPLSAGGELWLRLRADPRNEAAERWSDMQEEVAITALLLLLVAVLCSVTVAQGLRPLRDFSKAFARMELGETKLHLPAGGPPEIAVPAAAFNRMTAALDAAAASNRDLLDQISRLGEEERAAIARDLHDEVGPLLFGINAFAATIGSHVACQKLSEIPAQLRAIEEATTTIQAMVRDMLGRLHDDGRRVMSLRAALDELVLFWKMVTPDIVFSIDIDPAFSLDDLPAEEAAREVLFRVAQEAVSNAVRHGRPKSVALRVVQKNSIISLEVQDDGTEGMIVPGRGLLGMKNRAASMGGRLEIERKRGWTVTVFLPHHAGMVREAAEVHGHEYPAG